jgi:hypothetical protein
MKTDEKLTDVCVIPIARFYRIPLNGKWFLNTANLSKTLRESGYTEPEIERIIDESKRQLLTLNR